MVYCSYLTIIKNHQEKALSLSTIVDKHIFCFIFTDFSLESYTSLAGELLNDLTESFKQKLYEDLGISSYLN
jgi:hypothetical protein